MDVTLIFIVFLVLILIGAIVLTLSVGTSVEKKTGNAIDGTNFIPSQMFMGNDGMGGIAVNDRTPQFCVLKNPGLSPHILSLSRLIGSALVQNGTVVKEKLRTAPQSLLALQKELHMKVEKLIAGWKQDSTHPDNPRIDLIIMIQDEMDPLHIVNFLDMETKKGGIIYSKALSTATHWQQVLDGLIVQADQDARHHNESHQIALDTHSASLTGELEKLGDLVDKNIITPQEFTLLKEKLLGAKV